MLLTRFASAALLAALFLSTGSAAVDVPVAPTFVEEATSAAFKVSALIDSHGSVIMTWHKARNWFNQLLLNDWQAMAYSPVRLQNWETGFQTTSVKYTIRVNKARRKADDPAALYRCAGAVDAFAGYHSAIARFQAVVNVTLNGLVDALHDVGVPNTTRADCLDVVERDLRDFMLPSLKRSSPLALAAWEGFVVGHAKAAAQMRLSAMIPGLTLSNAELFLVAAGDELQSIVTMFAARLLVARGARQAQFDFNVRQKMTAFIHTLFAPQGQLSAADVLSSVDSTSGVTLVNRVSFLGDAALVWKSVHGANHSIAGIATPGAFFIPLTGGLIVGSTDFSVASTLATRRASQLWAQHLRFFRVHGPQTAFNIPVPFAFIAAVEAVRTDSVADLVATLQQGAACPLDCPPMSAVYMSVCRPRVDDDRYTIPFECAGVALVHHTPAEVVSSQTLPTPVATEIKTDSPLFFVVGAGSLPVDPALEQLVGGWHSNADSAVAAAAALFTKRARAFADILRLHSISPASQSQSASGICVAAKNLLTHPSRMALTTTSASPAWCATSPNHPTCDARTPLKNPFAVAPRLYDMAPEPPVLPTRFASVPLAKAAAADFFTPSPRAVVFTAVVSLPDAVMMQQPNGAVRANLLFGVPGEPDESWWNRTRLAQSFPETMNTTMLSSAAALRIPPSGAPTFVEIAVGVDGRLTDVDLETPVWLSVGVSVSGILAFLVVFSFVLYDPSAMSRPSSLLQARDSAAKYFAVGSSTVEPLLQRPPTPAAPGDDRYGACTPRADRARAM